MPKTLSPGWQGGGATVKNLAAQISGPASVSASTLAEFLARVNDLLSYANSVAADTTLTANVVAYIQQITGSSAVQADFSASLAALAALQAAIIKDYPVDGAGHVMDRTIDASGNIAWVSLTLAQLPNTLPAITNWLATVQ